MRIPGDSAMPLAISGMVYNTRGEVVPEAKVEIRQTDNSGHCGVEGYRYRAVLAPGAKGGYAIRSVIPGHYPTRAKSLVVGPVDSLAQVWGLADDPTLRVTLPFQFGGLNACAVSSDGKTLVAAEDDTMLRWYDTAA
jgi:hypothetical protein